MFNNDERRTEFQGKKTNKTVRKITRYVVKAYSGVRNFEI